MKRYGMVLRVRPEHEAEYRKYHEAVWPDVLDVIRQCNVANYTIFLRAGVLFGYYEYTGSDWAADMAKMAAFPRMQEWWRVMEPMQEPMPDRLPGEWWSFAEEVFHTD